MYIPPANAENRAEVIFDFIEAHSLGALVTSSPSGELFATHLPWLVDRARGEHGSLRGESAEPRDRFVADIVAARRPAGH
jgi:transcriptional regulator